MSAAEAASGSAIEFGPCGARSDPVVQIVCPNSLKFWREPQRCEPIAVESVRGPRLSPPRKGKNDETKKFLLGAHPPALSSRAGDAPNMAQLAQTTQAALSGQSKTVTVTVMGTSLVQTLVLLP